MSQIERRNNQLLRDNKVVILAKDINPEFWKHIFQAKYFRLGRVAAPLVGGSAVGLLNHDSNKPFSIAGGIVGLTIGSLISNPRFASKIKEAHGNIDFSRPILQPQYEKKYPEGWISASRIKETHPIFYIDLRGNLVFVKPTRVEYYRYLFQKSILGKLGYHTWWLRGYLEPPKAPESVKKWAREKLQKIMEQIKPVVRPVPKPALVRVRMGKQRTLPRKTGRR